MWASQDGAAAKIMQQQRGARERRLSSRRPAAGRWLFRRRPAVALSRLASCRDGVVPPFPT